MVQYRFNLMSIDELAHRIGSGVTFTEMGAAHRVERSPLSFIAGSNIDRFCAIYFGDPATFAPRGYYSASNATVIADGVITQAGNLLTGSSIMMANGFFPSVWTSPIFHAFDGRSIGAHVPEQRRFLPGRTISLVSLGWQVFGHMLLDVLPRVERMIRSGIAFDRFLLGKAQKWHKELITLVGVPEDKVVYLDNNYEAIDCEHLIVPVIDRIDTELHPDVMNVYAALSAQYIGDVPSTRNIFVSRRSWGGTRTLENRAEIENIAQDSGFEVVTPEVMSLFDQMKLFASARSVLGESGSGMHATLFSRKGVKVGVIQNWEHPNFLQSQIGAIANQSVGYALGELTFDERWTVDQDAVKRLAAFLIR